MIPVSQVSGCQGCPAYQDGSQGFVGDELVEGSEVLVEGQNPDAEEELVGRPFLGKAAKALEKTYLSLAGLQREKISVANAFRCRWQGGSDPPLLGRKGRLAEAALEHCKRAHFRVPASTKLIVAQGEYALQSLTGESKVTQWRGWLLPSDGSDTYQNCVWTPGPRDVPVLATQHLPALFYDRTMVLPTKMDWRKVRRFLDSKWPEPLPDIQRVAPLVWPRLSAFDTEFLPDGTLTRYSLATPERRLYVVEAENVGRVEVPGDVVVIMHNIGADVEHLSVILGGGRVQAEDTMLAHSVLWSDLPHDLGFLGSLYARTNRWKHLVVSNPVEYSGGDALGTWDSWVGLLGEFRADPTSLEVYREEVSPLTPIIMRATTTGLRLDERRVQVATEALEQQLAAIEARAQASVGWPLNLGSPLQVGHWLYQVEGLKPRGRRNVY